MKLNVIFAESHQGFAMDFGELTIVSEKIPVGEGGIYNGPYLVVPSVEAQTLQTAQKCLEHDISIKAIPIYDVTNIAGGSTVYIASEVQ